MAHTLSLNCTDLTPYNTSQASWRAEPQSPTPPSAAAWSRSLRSVPLHLTMDRPCPFSLIPWSPSLTGYGAWPTFTDLVGRMEGIYSSAQSRKHTLCQLSDSTSPEFCPRTPTWDILAVLAPPTHPRPTSTFPGSQPLLQATSRWHTHPYFLEKQQPDVLWDLGKEESQR